MIVAGWAWDDRILAAEQMSRSVQADFVVLLFALGAIGLFFAVLAFVAERLDRREWRRGILEAHQPRPFDWQRDEA